MIQFWTFRDGGHIAREQTVLFGKAKCAAKSRASHPASCGRVAPGLQVYEHLAHVRRREVGQPHLSDGRVYVDVHRSQIEGLSPKAHRARNSLRDPLVQVGLDGHSIRRESKALGNGGLDLLQPLRHFRASSAVHDLPRSSSTIPPEIDRTNPPTVFTLVNRSLTLTSSLAHLSPCASHLDLQPERRLVTSSPPVLERNSQDRYVESVGTCLS